MLCFACKQLFAGRAEATLTAESGDLDYSLHHPDIVSFRVAKEAACGICSKAWRKFMTDYKGEELEAPYENIVISAYAVPIPISETHPMNLLQLDHWRRQDHDGRTHIIVSNEAVSKGRWRRFRGVWYFHCNSLEFEMIPADKPDDRLPEDFGSSSNSPPSYRIAREWLRSCLHDHMPQYGELNSFFPTRVLDVGVMGERTIRLQTETSEASQVRENAPYATLSYCWGDTSHLKLEVKTLQKFEEGFNVMELPRTMRQAVALTRELRLRYLWIDSLCIIQDSEQDWQAQSALMGDIYQNSRISLVASSSTNSEGGLIFRRDPRLVQPIQVTCRFPFDDATKPLQLYNISRSPYYEFIEKEPLNTRGWVMQERLLAPRALHCTRKQLFWECEHLFASESHPDGIATYLDRRPGEFRRMLSRFTAASINAPWDREQDIAWFSLVREYSRCKLTKDKDILTALSGLAKRWNEAVRDQYLAGLWRNSFEEGLVWHAEARIPKYLKGERPTEWRAPSWSWASYKGAVSWSASVVPHEKLPRSVVGKARLSRFVRCSLSAYSTHGQLISGSATMEGVLVVGLAGSAPTSSTDPQVVLAANRRQHPMEMVFSYGPAARDFVIRTEHHEFTGFCYFDTQEWRRKLGNEGFLLLTCLPVLLHFHSHNRGTTKSDTEISMEIEGIFVEMVHGSHSAVSKYRRIGYFSVTSKLGDVQTGYGFSQSLVRGGGAVIPTRLGLGELEEIVLV